MTREPGRTCVGCRAVKPKRSLARLVRAESGLVVADVTGAARGRGAYVCSEPACLEQALQRGRLARAFRGSCEVGPGLAEEVRGRWQRRK